MISADVAKVLEELKAYHADTIRRMENMVRGFSYFISKTAPRFALETIFA